MKSTFKYYTLIILLLNNINCFSFDEGNLNKLLQVYINNLIEYSYSADFNDATGSILMGSYKDVFQDGNHHNELNPLQYDYSLVQYLAEIEQKYNRKIRVEIVNQKILKCSNSHNLKKYAYAKFTKIVQLPNDKPVTYDFLMIIDVTTSEYKIDQILLSYINDQQHLVDHCSKSTDSEELKRERELLQSQIKNLLESGNNFYSQQNYTEAVKSYELILKLDSKNQDALDGVNNCNYLITSIEYENSIEIFIKEKRYNDALRELENADKNNIKLELTYVNDIKKKCEEGIFQERIDLFLKLGNNYLKNSQFKQAREQYEKGLELDPNNNTLLNKLEESKNGDPYFVEKQLKIAYKNAVKSKKHYLSTFKTYKKFESSKLLTGQNYLFMMLMMLDKPSTVVKPMRYSKNLALNLAKEYFYKAKDKGANVSFYETQIFTKSIEKRKKY
ncbi:tetratricopeptide repeat protein [uncultured Lutibacter sp.]|uniref:tetratricopeptide repeat protein n=1 Tax=uncultured Lutibacter sp. TaxID=437739 RepID=UPI002634C55F|nr:tetratricopeptide repeat protein [uncultured Lutibacter sp.]